MANSQAEVDDDTHAAVQKLMDQPAVAEAVLRVLEYEEANGWIEGLELQPAPKRKQPAPAPQPKKVPKKAPKKAPPPAAVPKPHPEPAIDEEEPSYMPPPPRVPKGPAKMPTIEAMQWTLPDVLLRWPR